MNLCVRYVHVCYMLCTGQNRLLFARYVRTHILGVSEMREIKTKTATKKKISENKLAKCKLFVFQLDFCYSFIIPNLTLCVWCAQIIHCSCLQKNNNNIEKERERNNKGAMKGNKCLFSCVCICSLSKKKFEWRK